MMGIDREATLGDLCKSAALRWPERTVLTFDETGAELTFKDLEVQTNQLAYTLLRLGTQRGDRIAVIAGNRPIFPSAG